MEFFKNDAYSQVSECGRYSICRVQFGDRVEWEAWKRGKPPKMAASGLPSAQAAMVVCQGIEKERQQAEMSLKQQKPESS